MKLSLFFVLVLTLSAVHSQSIIEWSPEFELQLSDFQSSQTEINEELNSYSIYSGANMNFSYQMSTYEFMLTKNFNSKVKTTFNRNSAVIIAPDSVIAEELVKFGQYCFDLSELYTRKFRQEIYEQKGAFSDASFFNTIFDQLQEQMNAESARVLKQTDLGRETGTLAIEHQKVLSQIGQLADFCFDCRPPKKKKQKD